MQDPHGLFWCLQPFAQAVKQLWKEKRGDSAVANDDNDSLTDVEYEEVSKEMFGLLIAPSTAPQQHQVQRPTAPQQHQVQYPTAP
jgi:hypothetical protein